MSLIIRDLRGGIAGTEILTGVDLEVRPGEVHALMGPNGSGKSTLSHVLMGREGYEATGGSVTVDGTEILGLETSQRAAAGLFLAMQYPIEVPGVRIADLLGSSMRARGVDTAGLDDALAAEAARLEVRDEFLTRGVNVEFSGGEQKRAETLQLAVLRPGYAVLDEIDSGLDVDALRDVARRVKAMTTETGLGVLAITHYSRLLTELTPDVVHVFMGGRIVTSGGPELADELEAGGYDAIAARLGIEVPGPVQAIAADPFADPGF